MHWACAISCRATFPKPRKSKLARFSRALWRIFSVPRDRQPASFVTMRDNSLSRFHFGAIIMALIDGAADFAAWLDTRIDKFDAAILAGQSASHTRALLKADCAEARAIRRAFAE